MLDFLKDFFYYLDLFYVNFQYFSLILRSFSVQFFRKLPTIIGHRIT